METYSVQDGDLLISSDRSLLDFPLMHAFLKTTYWTPEISMEQLRRQVDNSTLVFGLYRTGEEKTQIGFCRVISDLTRFAYLGDVMIVASEQRRGLGQKLVAAAMQHPELKGVRKWLLATKDAHGVYAKLGFAPLENPEAYMVLKPEDAQWV